MLSRVRRRTGVSEGAPAAGKANCIRPPSPHTHWAEVNNGRCGHRKKEKKNSASPGGAIHAPRIAPPCHNPHLPKTCFHVSGDGSGARRQATQRRRRRRRFTWRGEEEEGVRACLLTYSGWPPPPPPLLSRPCTPPGCRRPGGRQSARTARSFRESPFHLRPRCHHRVAPP